MGDILCLILFPSPLLSHPPSLTRLLSPAPSHAPSHLSLLHAAPTRVEAAVPAFPDEPEGAAMADVTSPLDQRVVRLDHDERMGAVASDCHLD